MLFILLCLVAVLPFGKSSDTAEQTSSLIPGCHVADIPGVNYRCPSVHSGYIDHGKHCHNEDVSSQTESYIFRCSQGKWITVRTALRRSKRSDVGARVSSAVSIAVGGATIGSVAGPFGGIIGGVIGTYLGVVCAVFCYGPNIKDARSPTPPNLPPTITWNKPYVSTYHALPGNTFAVVEWYSPTAFDKEDGSVRAMQISGLPSNSKFSRGQHTITYRARDSNGLTVFDHFTFNVIVKVCTGRLSNPTNGYVTCNNIEKIAGTTCRYYCHNGYHLRGNSIRRCEFNGTFSGRTPRCQINTCPHSRHLKPNHGRAICHSSKLVYGTACYTECDLGYSLQPSGVSITTCQSDGRWSNILSDCRDSEPPTIIVCPSTQYVYADRGRATAVISWDVPTVTDNSGETIIAKKTKGQFPGTRFNLGVMEIRYSATDSSGNTSPDCIFSVHVDQQICDPPHIIDQYMQTVCPDGFSYGSECFLTCRGSYPLIGRSQISCERNITNPKKVYWDMGAGKKPYCKQNKCPDLLPPVHGALTCDDWMFGTHCMMHCNEEYDIPAGISGGDITRFTGQFTCSTSSGKWFPVETVPGCTVKRDPQNFYLPGKLYYYTGSCNDTATQQKIKERFIKEMRRLQQNGWEGICPNSNVCNVDNVNLKCGAARRRRDLYQPRQTRQINGASVLVTFEIVVKWEKYNNITDTRNHIERKVTSLGKLMEGTIESGSLDVEGAEIEQSSFQTGTTTIKCEPGRYPRYTTLTCASCPLGSVYNDVLEECTECPKGYYREDDDVLTCTQCPSGTSTSSSGTVNATDCVPICARGYYSLTGVSPCTPCSRFHYGPHEMATQCEECGPGLVTSAVGSTNESDCSAFDAVIGGGMLPYTVGQLQNMADGFTLALWIKIPRQHDVSLQVKIDDDIRIHIGGNINITFHRTHLQTDVELDKGAWKHVAVVSDAENITLFVQGDMQYTSRTQLMMERRASDVQLFSTGISDAELHISGLFLTSTSVYDGNIKSLSSTCYHTRKGAVTMDELKYADSNNIVLVSPSVCDADDNCDPDPCHGHTCIDDLDGFTCYCGGGFTGDLCQIPPDYCLNHQCEHGATCNNLQTNYTCLCTTGFKGVFCEYEIVDGGWGTWSNWSDCSEICDGGTRTRQRECSNPDPDPEGKPCTGDTMETEICNEELCPVCPPRPRSYGTVMECNVTSELTTCRVRCRDGLWFAPGYTPLPEYECGAETAYEWNGKPPSCSEIYIPDQLETVSTISYESNELCNKEKDMTAVLMMNALDNIECVQMETCQIDISLEGCIDQLKHSQNEVAVKAVITLKIPLEIEEINIVNNSSGADRSTVVNLLHAISTLENSTKQINISTNILRIEIDGHEYNALGVESYGKVDCRDGQIQLEAFCTDCPEGTYNQGGNKCTPCPYGKYQDKTGSTSCKECPNGFSTPFLESTNITDCSVPATFLATETAAAPEEDSSTGIIVGCTVGALFGCVVIVWITLWRFKRRKQETYDVAFFASKSLGDEHSASLLHLAIPESGDLVTTKLTAA